MEDVDFAELLDEEGCETAHDWFGKNECNMKNRKNYNALESARDAIEWLYWFCVFINAKNILQKKHEPALTPKERKRVRLNGKYAPYEYYTLEIDPYKMSTRYTDESDPTGIKHRMHLCRGHFSTYTEDKPLFGKYVGRYWIPSHVRGSAELGVIDKDYRVKLDTP